jgi:hypothetical protein
VFARLGFALAAVTLLCGCGGATRPAPKLLALGAYLVGGADGFEATQLLALDPQTLRPRAALKLGDAVASGVTGSSFVFSPNRGTLVFAGLNSHELLFVDPARLRITQRLKVPQLRAQNIDVEIAGWPRRDLLVAVTSLDGAWWAPHPTHVLLIDPVEGRVVRRVPLGGALAAAVTTSDGTIVLLRTPAGSGGVERGIPTLVVVRPSGRIRRLRLPPLTLEGREHLRLDGTSFPAERTAGLTTDGGRRAFVVAAGRPIAEMDVPTLRVRYHRVRIPATRFSVPAVTPGTAGVRYRFSRRGTWLGRALLAISGEDELPAEVGDPILGHRVDPIRAQLVDTRRWRVSRSLPATGCARVHELVLCSGGVRIRGGADAFDTGLVAYDRHWRARFRLPPPVSWAVAAGRLFVGSLDHRIVELDPRSGKLLRRVRPPDSTLPYDVVSWAPPR